VRKREGKVLVTDGPFAETREWIAGFDIFECADLDEAIAVAADHEMARHATAPTAEATDWPATTLSRA